MQVTLRLNVITIFVPPLRARMEDVPLLATTFLQRHADRMHKSVSRFSEDALKLLYRYQWRGNVRELDNVVGRAVLLSTGAEISAVELRSYLPEHKWEADRSPKTPRRISSRKHIKPSVKELARLSHLSLEELEHEFILFKLEQCSGNQVVTVEQLGSTTLWRKLKQYGKSDLVPRPMNQEEDSP